MGIPRDVKDTTVHRVWEVATYCATGEDKAMSRAVEDNTVPWDREGITNHAAGERGRGDARVP